MELFVLRLLERLIAVSMGGLAIYLGYRLFRSVKVTGEGDATVKLPGDVTVMVSRVGPGVFFALFGALVLGASLAFPVHYSQTEGPAGGAGMSVELTGIGPASLPAASASPEEVPPEIERLRVRQHIEVLNQVPQLLKAGLTAGQRGRIDQEILATKLRLMGSVWSEDWGAFDTFRLWAEGAAAAPESAAFRKAAAFFRFGGEASQ